jgi:hypothetical protein
MPEVQINVSNNEETQIVLAVPGTQGAMGSSFPSSGGTVNQVLIKNSSVDYDASWVNTWNISTLTINDGSY